MDLFEKGIPFFWGIFSASVLGFFSAFLFRGLKQEGRKEAKKEERKEEREEGRKEGRNEEGEEERKEGRHERKCGTLSGSHSIRASRLPPNPPPALLDF